MTIDNAEISDVYPFLPSAVAYVLYHADAAAGLDIVQDAFLESFPLHCCIQFDNAAMADNLDYVEPTEKASLLYILAERDMANLIQIHPSNLDCLQSKSEIYRTPLFAAIAAGSREAVRAFAEVHAATQPSESWFCKAL